jgi:hypothetical protein
MIFNSLTFIVFVIVLAVHNAHCAPEEDQPLVASYLFLRRVEPAFRHPPVVSTGRLWAANGWCGLNETEPERRDTHFRGREPQDARLFQVRRFPLPELRHVDRIGHLSATAMGHRASVGIVSTLFPLSYTDVICALKPAGSFLLALFITFFPHLVAGSCSRRPCAVR